MMDGENDVLLGVQHQRQCCCHATEDKNCIRIPKRTLYLSLFALTVLGVCSIVAVTTFRLVDHEAGNLLFNNKHTRSSADPRTSLDPAADITEPAASSLKDDPSASSVKDDRFKNDRKKQANRIQDEKNKEDSSENLANADNERVGNANDESDDKKNNGAKMPADSSMANIDDGASGNPPPGAIERPSSIGSKENKSEQNDDKNGGECNTTCNTTMDTQDTSNKNTRTHYHMLVADQICAANIDSYLKYICKEEHLAGTPAGRERAEWVHKKFASFGFDSVTDSKYNVLLSYPLGPGNITIYDKDGTELGKMTVVERNLNEFESDAMPVLPPFLAYSQSGSVEVFEANFCFRRCYKEGELIYANYGSEQDFARLKKMNIDVKGKVILIRYGKLSRNKKIKYAEWYGVKGVILFSDPENYSPTGVVFPETWYLPGDGVQRGTLLRMRGDALSRGYPALEGLYSRPIDEVTYFPTVPVQPIGYSQAEKLLGFLDGQSGPDVSWSGRLNMTYKVTSKDGRKVKLHVNVTREKRDIIDVIGVIRGREEPGKEFD